MSLDVLVTVSPTSAGTQRIDDLVKWLVPEVRKNEPWVSNYTAYKTPASDEEGTTEYLIFFT